MWIRSGSSSQDHTAAHSLTVLGVQAKQIAGILRQILHAQSRFIFQKPTIEIDARSLFNRQPQTEAQKHHKGKASVPTANDGQSLRSTLNRLSGKSRAADPLARIAT